MSQDPPDSLREDPSVGSADEPLPWTEMLNNQLMQIYIEFAQNDDRQKITATRRTTFREIKEVICRSCCTTPDKLIIYWMGDEMLNDMMLADVVGWRDACSTTFHCEDRELLAARGVKRSRPE